MSTSKTTSSSSPEASRQTASAISSGSSVAYGAAWLGEHLVDVAALDQASDYERADAYAVIAILGQSGSKGAGVGPERGGGGPVGAEERQRDERAEP